jgi:hypothetical protein
MKPAKILKTIRVCNSVGKMKYSLNTNDFFLRAMSPRFAFYESHSNEEDIHKKMSDYKVSFHKYKIYNNPLEYNDVAEGKYDYPPSGGLTDYEYDYYYDYDSHTIASSINSKWIK